MRRSIPKYHPTGHTLGETRTARPYRGYFIRWGEWFTIARVTDWGLGEFHEMTRTEALAVARETADTYRKTVTIYTPTGRTFAHILPTP